MFSLICIFWNIERTEADQRVMNLYKNDYHVNTLLFVCAWSNFEILPTVSYSIIDLSDYKDTGISLTSQQNTALYREIRAIEGQVTVETPVIYPD